MPEVVAPPTFSCPSDTAGTDQMEDLQRHKDKTKGSHLGLVYTWRNDVKVQELIARHIHVHAQLYIRGSRTATSTYTDIQYIRTRELYRLSPWNLYVHVMNVQYT